MQYKTYKGWQSAGYQVQRGEKSHKRINGIAVFSEEQVEEYDEYEEYYNTPKSSGVQYQEDYDYDDPYEWDTLWLEAGPFI